MTVSRLSQARKAIRPALKGRMMLSGPAGAGKTRSSLIIATVLAEGAAILGIDTEKESMLTYADDFDFTHLAWAPPFDPRELVGVLAEAGGDYGVIVIDSLSHFWRKEGGVLDIAGGKFTGWKEARPAQESLVEAILNCPAHVVLGVRSKVEHTQETENGRQVVKKLGMASQQDDDLEFEMNVAVELSMDHTATISKSRTTVLPVGRAFRGGQMAEMAKLYGEWLKGGEPPAAREVAVGLLDRMNALTPERRAACKNEFVAKFGRPEQLRESQVAEAEKLVAAWENPEPDLVDPPADDPGRPEDAPAAADTDSPTTNEGSEPKAPQAEHPANGKGKRSPASQLHVDTKDWVSPDDLRVLIANESHGRTTSANDLTQKELDAVWWNAKAISEGTLDIVPIRNKVAEAGGQQSMVEAS